jgi:hypothetical protein
MGKSTISMGKFIISIGKPSISMGKSPFSMGKIHKCSTYHLLWGFVNCRRGR